MINIMMHFIRILPKLEFNSNRFDCTWEKLMIKKHFTEYNKGGKTAAAEKRFQLDRLCVHQCMNVSTTSSLLLDSISFPIFIFSQLKMEPGNSFSTTPPVVCHWSPCRRFILSHWIDEWEKESDTAKLNPITDK